MAQTNYPTQDKATSLYGSGVSIGDTSVRLSALTDIYGNVLTMADVGLKGFGTLEPGTDNEEAITFSGITANGDGSQTLTGVKHVLAKPPFTETSGLSRGHSGGTRFVMSNSGAFYNDFYNYVNSVVVGGAQDASTTTKGITKLTTAPVSPIDPIAVGATDVATTGASKVIRSKANSTIDDSLLNLTTAGDVPYSDGTDVQRLALGAPGTFLTAGATAPVYTSYPNLPEADTFFGATNITGAQATSLTDGSVLTTLHSHKKTYGVAAGSGTTSQVITHNLGVTPNFLRISAFGDVLPGSGSNFPIASRGVFNGTTYATASQAQNGSGQISTTVIIFCNSGGVNTVSATVAMSSTTFTLTWSTTGNSGVAFLWEAEF